MITIHQCRNAFFMQVPSRQRPGGRRDGRASGEAPAAPGALTPSPQSPPPPPPEAAHPMPPTALFDALYDYHPHRPLVDTSRSLLVLPTKAELIETLQGVLQSVENTQDRISTTSSPDPHPAPAGILGFCSPQIQIHPTTDNGYLVLLVAPAVRPDEFPSMVEAAAEVDVDPSETWRGEPQTPAWLSQAAAVLDRIMRLRVGEAGGDESSVYGFTDPDEVVDFVKQHMNLNEPKG